jgi:hypothetical protein
MTAARLFYRTRQFWQTLRASASAEDLELAAAALTGPQLALFQQMQTSEQAHCLRMHAALIAMGEKDPDLLTAALLHDVGKILLPLRPWERALIVFANWICPRCVKRWGGFAPGDSQDRLGWRRAFVAAVQHPAWGGELAASCNSSPLAVTLIRRHQEGLSSGEDPDDSLEDRLLRKLQAVDNDY